VLTVHRQKLNARLPNGAGTARVLTGSPGATARQAPHIMRHQSQRPRPAQESAGKRRQAPPHQARPHAAPGDLALAEGFSSVDRQGQAWPFTSTLQAAGASHSAARPPAEESAPLATALSPTQRQSAAAAAAAGGDGAPNGVGRHRQVAVPGPVGEPRQQMGRNTRPAPTPAGQRRTPASRAQADQARAQRALWA